MVELLRLMESTTGETLRPVDDREDIGYFLLIVGTVFTYLTISGLADERSLNLLWAAIALICLVKGFQWTGFGGSLFVPGKSDNPTWVRWSPAVLLLVSGALVVGSFVLLVATG